jgi:hypothetical protein
MLDLVGCQLMLGFPRVSFEGWGTEGLIENRLGKAEESRVLQRILLLLILSQQLQMCISEN